MAGLGAIGTTSLALIAWGIKALIMATLKNTQELAVLNSKIEQMVAFQEKLPKIEKDIDEFHKWKRSVQLKKRKGDV